MVASTVELNVVMLVEAIESIPVVADENAIVSRAPIVLKMQYEFNPNRVLTEFAASVQVTILIAPPSFNLNVIVGPGIGPVVNIPCVTMLIILPTLIQLEGSISVPSPVPIKFVSVIVFATVVSCVEQKRTAGILEVLLLNVFGVNRKNFHIGLTKSPYNSSYD